MRAGIAVVALAIMLVLAGCEATDAGLEEPNAAVEDEKKITESPAKDPRLVVGDTAVTTKDGNELAVLSYESPVSVEGAKPEPRFEYSVIEVEGCASRSSGRDAMHIGSNGFTLRLPKNGDTHAEGFDGDAKVKQPALETMDAPPGSCDRGFVTFQTPKGERADLVLFEEQFVLKSVIAWEIPAES